MSLDLIIIILLMMTTLFESLFSMPLDESNKAYITKYLFDKQPSGEYHYEYETSDGQRKSEHGQIIISESDTKELYVYGTYSYIGDDGKTYEVNYGAGRNGFVINPTFPAFAPSAVTEKGISSDCLGSLCGGGIGK